MITRSRSRSSEDTPVPDDSQASSQSVSDSAPLEEVDPAPRMRKKRGGKGRGRGTSRKQDQWVCLMPKSFLSSADEQEDACFKSIVSLKNPSSNCVSKYLLKENHADGQHSELCEILNFSSDEPRSWFLGNTIHTDGGLCMCVPVDPLFLALPYFQAAGKSAKFTTMDVILEDDPYEVFRILSECVPAEQWTNISETKNVGTSLTVYRYCKERTLAWLQKKVSALAETLEEESVYVGRGSQSSMLVKSTKDSEVNKDDYVKFACGMIGDYLNKDLLQELTAIYSVATIGSAEKPVEGEGENGSELEPPAAKRRHMAPSEPLEDYSHCGQVAAQPAAKTVAKESAAQKTLAKIDRTGIKSLSNFFKKKKGTT